MFEQIIWQEDRALLNSLVFRLEQKKSQNWELGDNCFDFYKDKTLIGEYQKFWLKHNDIKINNVLELGLWDGGSLAFWFELLQPQKHVGIDIQDRKDSRYFQEYVNSRGLQNNIKTYWNTNQANSNQLKEIINNEFNNELLDLVIDDASHLYEQTKTSFETLFPFLRSGGLYIIEDWAWWHWKELEKSRFFSGKTPLTNLIFELIEATGTTRDLISNMTCYTGFVVIEKGEKSLINVDDFTLDQYIYRHSPKKTNENLTLTGRLKKIIKVLKE